MRIATWNVNSLKARLGKLEEWLSYAEPDVVCLQETKMSDAAFPTMAFAALGYESAHHATGDGTESPSCRGWGSNMCEPAFRVSSRRDRECRMLTARCGGFGSRAYTCRTVAPWAANSTSSSFRG